MEVLAFIEQRFRMGIRILPAEIEDVLHEDDAAAVCGAGIAGAAGGGDLEADPGGAAAAEGVEAAE